MYGFNNRIREQYSEQPIVQTWEPPQQRYRSVCEYMLDPVANRINTFCNSRPWEATYSSSKKAFYAPVPYNTQVFGPAPIMGEFDYTRLRQTNVLDLIYSRNSQPSQFGKISLAHTISPLVNKMGSMEDLATGENLGTCTLIARDFVLVARHSVEGRDIRNLHVTFGYTTYNGSTNRAGQTSFDCVVEEDASCDYAIIRLKNPLGSRLGFVPLNTECQVNTEPALLHYPLGKSLKVSVHTFNHTQNQSERVLAYHDSDYYSSGGAYFNPKGHMTAMHLGTEPGEGSMNLLRYALPLEKIVRNNPYSLIQKFARGELSQGESYTRDTGLIYLAPTNHNYLIDEEGYQSEKILRGLLTNELQTDKNIKLNKDGTISFSKSNLNYIAGKYPQKFQAFKTSCLGITGLHGKTHQYSVNGVIESDHTIPHSVWKSTTNPKMSKFVVGRGKRPGEDNIPAITIPYDIHRDLLTTGGVPGYKQFHQKLTHLCNQDRIDDTLIACYRECDAKGLDLDDYESDIKRSLSDHVQLGLISNAQRKKILYQFY